MNNGAREDIEARENMADAIARRDEVIERMAQALEGAKAMMGRCIIGIHKADVVLKVSTACCEALKFAKDYRRTIKNARHNGPRSCSSSQKKTQETSAASGASSPQAGSDGQ